MSSLTCRSLVALMMASACTNCRAVDQFKWRTDGGIVCDARCPDGSTCLSDLTCTQMPDWQCGEAVPVDGGSWRPCWGLGPVSVTVGGGPVDGPWGLGAECCCEPSCGTATVPGRERWPLVCGDDTEAPPRPFTCTEGVVTWPRTSP